MGKLFVVIKRESVSLIRTKSFMYSTIILPIFMIAIFILPQMLVNEVQSGPIKYGIVDQSNMVWGKIDLAMRAKYSGKISFLIFGNSLSYEKQRQEVVSGRVDAMVVVPANFFETGTLTVYSKSILKQERPLRDGFNEIFHKYRFEQNGLDYDLVKMLSAELVIKTVKVSEKNGPDDPEPYFILAFVMALILYMTLVRYGSILLRSIQEDKNSKIVEIIFSSIAPLYLLIGKIVGVGLAGLFQYFIWGTCLFLMASLTKMGSRPILTTFDFTVVSPDMIAFFMIFFVLGFLLYASLFAMVGSAVSAQEDANQMQTPIILLLIVPVVMMSFILQQPDSKLAVIFSMIPFFSPTIMFMRIVVSDPPIIQIVMSLTFLIISILLFLFIAARIYQVGILRYGKRPKLAEMGRWILSK